MPNQIIAQGIVQLNSPMIAASEPTSEPTLDSEALLKADFDQAWQLIVDVCREWIESELDIKPPKAPNHQGWRSYWKRDWGLWAKYAWEFFLVQGLPGESISAVRERLNERKRQRAWTGINWQGESSTLSGTDAIAHPSMGRKVHPKRSYLHQEDDIQPYFDGLTATLAANGRLAPLTTDGTLKNGRIESLHDEIQAFYHHLRYQLGYRFAELNRKPIQEADRYGSPFIDLREELSIPELIKRLITHKAIVNALEGQFQQQQEGTDDLKQAIQELQVEISEDLSLDSFRDLNRLPNKDNRSSTEEVHWTGWFVGDGDEAGQYFLKLGAQDRDAEASGTTDFSQVMRDWGEEFKVTERVPNCPYRMSKHLGNKGRVIYAGGDDFMGVLYDPERQLQPQFCLDWFTRFKAQIWDGIDPKPTGQPKPISVSVGFVWAGPQVPQREILQQCRAAEKSAKTQGKDRIAFRILFNSGNTMEWSCPWRFLPVLQDYCDREGRQNWAHIYNDIAVLETRHAFQSTDEDGNWVNNQLELALALFNVYFRPEHSPPESDWETEHKRLFYELVTTTDTELHEFQHPHWLNSTEQIHPDDSTRTRLLGGLFGKRESFTDDRKPDGALNPKKMRTALTNWIINLAKVGYYLHKQYGTAHE